jgi:hypothetical protein
MIWAHARSLRHKLMLVVVTTTLAALIVAGVAMEVYDLRVYQRSSVNDLFTQADIVGRAAAPALTFDDPKAANEDLLLLKATPNIFAAAIYTSKGTLFANYSQNGATDPQFPSLPEADSSRIDGKEIVIFKRIIENGEILGTVYLRAHYELLERFESYAGILGIVTIASLLVAVFLSYRLNAAVTEPILEISSVATTCWRKLVVEPTFSRHRTRR